MKTRRTPQEKKQLSYLKDRRNDYGENNKASRKSIALRKRWVNRSYRRTIKQTIVRATIVLDKADDLVKQVRRKRWKKHPDKPLGEYLHDKAAFKAKYG